MTMASMVSSTPCCDDDTVRHSPHHTVESLHWSWGKSEMIDAACNADEESSIRIDSSEALSTEALMYCSCPMKVYVA